MNKQKNSSPLGLSCEFFPPKTEQGNENLLVTIDQLGQLKPDYFSCTYGAGASSQHGTYETIKSIINKGYTAAPHITCIDSSKQKIQQLLDDYQALNIRRIVALRGDLPSGQDKAGEFQHASDLIDFIRQQTGDYFHIEVAAYPEKHPEAKSFNEDIVNLKLKAEAGASSGITQYFFNVDAYTRFVDNCVAAGLDLPIYVGVMPITNYKQLARFSLQCGAEIPRWIAQRLIDFGDDLNSIRDFGVDVVTDLCQQVIAAGTPGLHFYTLNRPQATTAIWQNLGR